MKRRRSFLFLVFLIVLLVNQIALLQFDFVPMVYATTAFSAILLKSIHTCPLDTHTFVIVYVDETNDYISFQIWDTNGTQVLAEVDVDDTSGGSNVYTNVGVSALSSTTFVIAWEDYTEQDVTFAVYDKAGTLLYGPTDADTDAGSSGSVQVSCFNSTYFVIGWFDRTALAAQFSIYDSSNSTVKVGPITVATTLSTAYSVSVSTFNSTLFVIGWFDSTLKHATFAIYNDAGTNLTMPIVAGDNIGTARSVSVSTLNSTHFVMGWFNATGQVASFAVYDSTGTLKTGPTNADAAVGTQSYSVQVAALNSTAFIISWYDYVDFDLTFATYLSDGTAIASATDVESWPTAANLPFTFQSPCSQETATGIKIYNDNWIIAYANTTTEAIWKVFKPNGTIPEYTPPTYSNIATNTTIAEATCLFYTKWTDETGLATTGGYIYGTNNTGAWVNETWTAFTANPDWSNITKILNSTKQVVVQWQIWVNDTSNNWNYTGTQSLTIWEQQPYVFETDLGVNLGESLDNIFYNATEGKAAVYVAYQNSSFTPWQYQARAFDVNARVWTASQYIADSASDGHMSPSISVLPDGRLIILYGYYTPIYYRISTYNASIETNLTKLISNWGDKQNFTAPTTYYCYPHPLRWNDDFIVTTRQSGSGDGNWTYERWNATSQSFDPQITLLTFKPLSSTSLYAGFSVSGNNILCSFNRYYSDIGEDRNLYFIYSPDKGYTWKNITGSTLTLPIYGEDALIMASSFRTRADDMVPPFIDENGKVVVSCWRTSTVYFQAVLGDIWMKTCQYSAGLGQAGTWTFSNITDFEGVQIWGRGAIYINLYYGRPCLFTTDSYGNKKVSAYVRYPNETHKFKMVWEDDEAYVASSPLHIVSGYRYEVMCIEASYGLLGFSENGVSANDTMLNTIYGVKFTAQQTGVLVGVQMYAYAVSGRTWKAALYNSTFYMVANTSVNSYTTGTDNLGWLQTVQFSNRPIVNQGEVYSLCFMVELDQVQHYYNVSEVVNQTFTYPSTWAEGFPDTLSPTVYYNRTISIVAFSTSIRIRGLGDVFPTALLVGWNEISSWTEDVGRTLEQICANIQFGGIDSTIIIKYNGTEYQYDYGYEPNATILILVTSDELQIYCTTAGSWWHDYSNFCYLKSSPSQSLNISLSMETLTERFKTLSILIGMALGMSRSMEFFRSVSQPITTTLKGQRLIDILRSVSQVVALTLQSTASKIAIYLIDASLAIITSFQASRLAEWFRAVAQAIAMIFESIRLGEWFRSVSQLIAASLIANRLIDITRTTGLLLGISAITLKLAQFARASSQSFSFGFATTGIADFFRSVTQSITATLTVQRLSELFRSASQSLTFTLQATGERIALYLRDVALTITTSLQASRLADWIRTVSQTLSIIVQSLRLSELWKATSQTISASFAANRLIDVTRLANQSAGFSFGSSRLAEFVRTTSQAINVNFAVASLADFFRTVSQAITATLNAQRLIEVSKQVSQAITFSLQAIGERVGIYVRNAVLTVTLTLQGSRLAEWLKTVSQSISLAFGTAKLGTFARSVAQTVSVILNGSRIVELFRSASQAITLTLIGIGEKIGVYLRTAALTITTAFQGSRLAEWIKASSQTISITLGSARLAEFIRSASQTVALAFSSVGEKLGNYVANVALTITATLQTSRTAEWIKQATQTLTLSLSTSRIAEFLALVTLTIMATVNADRLMLFVRQSSQTLSFIFNGERIIEVSRSVSQTITLTLVGFGEFVGDYFRNAVLNVGFTFATLAEVPEATILLALAIALIVVACVVTYAVAKTQTEKD